MTVLQAPAHSKFRAATGLKAAVAILDNWGATGDQATAILRVSRSTLARAKRRDPEWQVSLDEDQLTRLSLVLNIHTALRVIFDNPENLYGFMAMHNHNEGFNGRSALEIIANGSMLSLYDVFQRIDSLRGAQW